MTQRLLLFVIFCLSSWTLSAQLSPVTSLRLEFAANGENTVTATASDSGNGLSVDGSISLSESTAYTLSITLLNGTTDITSEVTTNADQLQFFFAPSEGILADGPSYNDMDANMLPLGLSTSLTGSCVSENNLTGTFRIALNDLGNQKAANSTIDNGSSIFDLSWPISIIDDASAPACENEEEIIDRVTLTFTPTAGGDPIVAIAADPDGPGPMDLVVQPISLDESTEYDLSITLENTIEGEDITAEIREEDDEHQLFFAFGEDLFESPDGDGNIDNGTDPVNYSDQDDDGNPVGLATNWTTACTGDGNQTGNFRIILKHQPGAKSATSGVDVGGTDLDISWNITIIDDASAPACENEEEIIDRVTLTFTPTAGGDPIVAIAADPDGPGPMDLVVQPISLDESTEYDLSITLENTIEGEDITAEIREEDDEHQLFFAFGEDLFESPDGDGNIDNGTDPVNYSDQDDDGNPVGLATNWTTACTGDGNQTGNFRIILKHQPGAKSATSGVDVGGTDLDISWNITIIDDASAPACENEEEIIDRVTLTFTPTAGGDPIVAIAADPDGPGPMDLVVQPISLDESTEYDLSITLENTIEGEDITAEIREEDDEHQLFFAFGEDLFESPDGDGNIDNGTDPVNYSDQDDDGNPVGLATNWTTACTGDGNQTGNFRIILKHQPGAKSATSGVDVGGTDLDISWNITIIDDASAPACENEEEIIDRVTLTFTPTAGGDPIVAIAADPDGPGPMDLVVQPINLEENTAYDLNIKIENTIEGEDITAEILEEDEEHQFYFAWTGDIFSQPTGDGNIDNSSDPVGYNDQDENGLPVGLSTNWTTSAAMSSGTLRIGLKHQPGIKSNTSTFADGGTDLDITWNINSIVSSTNNLRPDQRLTIAPNPVQDNLYFLTRNVDLSQSTVLIFNSVGAQVRTLRNPNNEINISDLAPGMYTVLIRGEQLRWNGRFVKTNN